MNRKGSESIDTLFDSDVFKVSDRKGSRVVRRGRKLYQHRGVMFIMDQSIKHTTNPVGFWIPCYQSWFSKQKLNNFKKRMNQIIDRKYR